MSECTVQRLKKRTSCVCTSVRLDRPCENEVLLRVKKEINIIHTIKRRKTNWFCQILSRTCFLKHFIDGKIEGTGRRRIKCRQLLDNLEEARRYWNFKAEALYRRLWRIGFVTGYRPVVIQTTRWWSEGLQEIWRTTSKSLIQDIVVPISIRTGHLAISS